MKFPFHWGKKAFPGGKKGVVQKFYFEKFLDYSLSLGMSVKQMQYKESRVNLKIERLNLKLG